MLIRKCDVEVEGNEVRYDGIRGKILDGKGDEYVIGSTWASKVSKLFMINVPRMELYYDDTYKVVVFREGISSWVENKRKEGKIDKTSKFMINVASLFVQAVNGQVLTKEVEDNLYQMNNVSILNLVFSARPWVIEKDITLGFRGWLSGETTFMKVLKEITEKDLVEIVDSYPDSLINSKAEKFKKCVKRLLIVKEELSSFKVR